MIGQLSRDKTVVHPVKIATVKMEASVYPGKGSEPILHLEQ